jgi:hypothetical protein
MEVNMCDEAKTASREKYWNELDSEGKIERLNFALKQQRNTIETLIRYVKELIGHQHLANGDIVKKIEKPGHITPDGIYLPFNGPKWL